MTGILVVAVIWVINLGISYLNARTVGLMWVETKYIGGWQRFMAWMGAIMSASGFTWCYLIVLLLGGYYLQFGFLKPDAQGVVHPLITLDHVQGGFALGYLIIIPGILFSGLMIWVDSMIQAWKRRDFASVGTAAWNTFAQIHNTYSAMRGVPEAIGKVSEVFLGKGSKSDKKGAVIVLLLVILAVISGVLTTMSIINKYAGTRPLPGSEGNLARGREYARA
jgi:hypothetical protein